jgi:branched-chain amino acid transport system substrate-binding protein
MLDVDILWSVTFLSKTLTHCLPKQQRNKSLCFLQQYAVLCNDTKHFARGTTTMISIHTVFQTLRQAALRRALPASFALLVLLTPMCEAKDIVIGQVAALLGDPLASAFQMRSGVELYFEVVNRAGGVHGGMLKLVTKERGTAIADAVPKTRQLIEEAKPVALIALQGTGPMDALVKEGVLEKAGIPAVGIRTGATSLHQPVNPWLFHTRASYAVEADRMVRHLSTIGFHKIGVFYENTAFGKEALKHTLEALAKAGLKPIAVATYESNTNNVAQAVTTLRAAEPDAVILASSSVAAGELFKGFRQGGAGRIQLVAFSTVDASTVVKLIGKAEARGLGIAQVVPDPGNRRSPIVREFQDHAKKLRPPEHELTQGALEGYIAAKVLVEGLKRAGPKMTSGKLQQALEGIDGFDAGGLIIGFSSSSHSGSSYVNIGILSADGKMMQ